jgi:hypothetical protein
MRYVLAMSAALLVLNLGKHRSNSPILCKRRSYLLNKYPDSSIKLYGTMRDLSHLGIEVPGNLEYFISNLKTKFHASNFKNNILYIQTFNPVCTLFRVEFSKMLK